MLRSIARLPARCALLFAIGVLAACASRPQHTAAGAAKDEIVAVRMGSGAHRFDMQQNGRSMTAEEFDAWMKARGIRVATGAPAKPKASSTAKRAR